MKNFIAASLIAADFWSLSKEFKKLDDTQVKWVHYDIMDGHFVPNISVGSCELSSLIKKTNIEIDIHFMVTNPDIIVPNFIKMFNKFLTLPFGQCIWVHWIYFLFFISRELFRKTVTACRRCINKFFSFKLT